MPTKVQRIDTRTTALRHWCRFYGIVAVLLLVWLCTVASPATFRFAYFEGRGRWVFHGFNYTSDGVRVRVGLALVAGCLLYCGRTPQRKSELLPIGDDPPRWMQNTPARSGFEIMTLLAVIFGGCVALAVCKYLPVVDYRLLFIGHSSRDSVNGPEALTYDPTPEIVEFRSLLTIFLLVVAVALLYLYHWRNNALLRQERESELITID
jgi:hypothetical protein